MLKIDSIIFAKSHMSVDFNIYIYIMDYSLKIKTKKNHKNSCVI